MQQTVQNPETRRQLYILSFFSTCIFELYLRIDCYSYKGTYLKQIIFFSGAYYVTYIYLSTLSMGQ